MEDASLPFFMVFTKKKNYCNNIVKNNFYDIIYLMINCGLNNKTLFDGLTAR